MYYDYDRVSKIPDFNQKLIWFHPILFQANPKIFSSSSDKFRLISIIHESAKDKAN